MPIYEYECAKCGKTIEVIQKFSDKPIKKCPKCGKAVERLVSSSSIQFKGSGWYVTDYAKRSGPTDVKSEAKSEQDSSTSKEAAPATSDKTDKSEKSSEKKTKEAGKPDSAPAKNK